MLLWRSYVGVTFTPEEDWRIAPLPRDGQVRFMTLAAGRASGLLAAFALALALALALGAGLAPPWPRPRFASGFGEAAAFTFGAAAGFRLAPRPRDLLVLGVSVACDWELSMSCHKLPSASQLPLAEAEPGPLALLLLPAGVVASLAAR